jgi:hypothetical protein
MKCPRCSFENMPGLTTCFRCGSVMASGETAVNVYPPRATRWEKIVRSVRRAFRRASPARLRVRGDASLDELRRRVVTEETAWHWTSVLPTVLRTVGGLFLPGLVHLLERRFRSVLWYWLAWIVTLCAALFLYGDMVGAILYGSAVALHAMVLAESIPRVGWKDVGTRGGVLLAGMAFVWALYWTISETALHDLTGVNTALTIPYHKVQSGDYLLALRSRAQGPLPRGALVAVSPQVATGYRGRGWGRGGTRGAMIGEIVGLPEEHVRVEDGAFVVDNVRLDPVVYPVQTGIPRYRGEIVVPRDSYFVSLPYNSSTHGNAAEAQVLTAVSEAFVHPAGEIHARAVMRWLPLGRRGFIQETP